MHRIREVEIDNRNFQYAVKELGDKLDILQKIINDARDRHIDIKLVY